MKTKLLINSLIVVLANIFVQSSCLAGNSPADQPQDPASRSVKIAQAGDQVKRAQKGPSGFLKAGDRVEVHMGLHWYKATVLIVRPPVYAGGPPDAYFVRLDEGQECNISAVSADIHALQGPDTPQAPQNNQAPGPGNNQANQTQAPANPNPNPMAAQTPTAPVDPQTKMAQKGPSGFLKAGDRVEVRQGFTWYKATVLAVRPPVYPGGPPDAYFVRMDGAYRQEVNVPAIANDIRAVQGADTPPADPPTQKAHNAADGTVLPDRPCVNCTGETRGNNGDPPPIEVLKRLAQCIWEQPSYPGADGAVTVDIRSFNANGSRLNGRGARDTAQRFTDPLTSDPNRVIYMFNVSYVKKTFFRSRTDVEDVTQQVFEAYVDMQGIWRVHHSSGPYQKTMSSIQKG